ncbi:uncharacterized protein METZ01_LOCUS124131 [marine metagenome]|uniref:Uncharacterized protein n=1 Tax=marine metagenome TaxID=408172 RepID=A0A381Y4G4_9ZZZZ
MIGYWGTSAILFCFQSITIDSCLDNRLGD